MKFKLHLLTFFIAINTIIAQDKNPQNINISRKQSLLSQRLTKNYILSSLDTKFDDFSTKVQQDEISFSRQLENLYNTYQKKNSILSLLDMERSDWFLLANATESPIKKNDKEVERLIKFSKNIAQSTTNVSQQIENYINSDRSTSEKQISALANQQIILSQQLCIYFSTLQFLETYKSSRSIKKTIKTELEKTINEIDTDLKILYSADVNDSVDIKNHIANISDIFNKILNDKTLILTGKAPLEYIYNITNELSNKNQILIDFYSK